MTEIAEIRVLPVADRVEEELLARARAGRGAALGSDVITIGELERRLEGAAGLSPVPPLTARLVATRVLPAAARGTTFQPVAAEPGFAPAFLAAFDAVRDGGLSVAAIAELSQRTHGLTRRRLEAMAKLGRAYEAALAQAGLVDARGARSLLVDRIVVPETLRGARLILEDVVDLPVVRCRTLAALVAAGVEVVVRLPALEDRPGLAAAMEPLHRALALDAPGVKVEGKPLGGGALDAFHRRLFDPTAPAAIGAPLRAFEGGDEAAEIRAAVRAVREQLAAGVAADDVVIAARGLSRIRDRLAAALESAGIPWRDRRGTPAIDAPPAALALQLVTAAERRLPREELARVITSAYVEAGAEGANGEPSLTARHIADLLRHAASRDDSGEGHAARLHAFAKRLQTGAGRDAVRDARMASRAAARLEQLLPLLRLPDRAPLPHLAATLAGALSALGVERRCHALEERGHATVDAAAARALARDRAAIDVVFEVARSIGACAQQAGLASTPFPLPHFREILAAEIEAITLRRRGPRGGAVRLVDVTELPGRSIPHVVLVGLFDGGFPLRRAPEPLLDGGDREALNRAAGRPVIRSRAGEEPLLFALACLAARDGLVLTASRADAAGWDRVRSPFLDEALAAAGLTQPQPEPAAVVPPLAAASSPREAMARLAQLAAGAAPVAGEGAAPQELAAELARAVDLARRGFPAGAAARVERATIGNDAALAAISAGLAKAAAVHGPDVAWLTSVSALEDYAACPFRFLGKRVLRLPEPMQRGDDLDLRENGSLLHELAREAFTALQVAGLLPLAGGRRAAEEERVARAACERALTAWESRERTGPAPLWNVTREAATESVLRLVAKEAREAEGVVPLALEAAFGEGDEPPLFLPSPDGPGRIAVRGRVDRVDSGPAGLVVIDYKSGRVYDRVRGEEQGRSRFQLPIYAAWARRRFGGDVDGIYRSFRDGSKSKPLSHFGPDQLDLEALLELDPERRREGRAGQMVSPAAGARGLPGEVDPNLADAAWAFLASIRSGHFPVAPADPDEDCRFCSLATVCRVDRHGGDL